jgi:hypothetical protein
VSEEHVRDVCRQILEDAKQMYCSSSQSRGSSPFNELSDSETGSIGEYRFGQPNARVSHCLPISVSSSRLWINNTATNSIFFLLMLDDQMFPFHQPTLLLHRLAVLLILCS